MKRGQPDAGVQVRQQRRWSLPPWPAPACAEVLLSHIGVDNPPAAARAGAAWRAAPCPWPTCLTGRAAGLGGRRASARPCRRPLRPPAAHPGRAPGCRAAPARPRPPGTTCARLRTRPQRGLSARGATIAAQHGPRSAHAALGRRPPHPPGRRRAAPRRPSRAPSAAARPRAAPTCRRRAASRALRGAAAQRAAACGARPMPATSKRSAPPPPSRTRRSLAAAAWAAAASQAPRRHASASPASALAASAARAPASTSSASSGSRALGAHAALRSRSSRSSLCAHVRLGPSRQRRGSPRCDAAEHRAAAAGGAPAELRGEREDGVAVRRRRAVGRRAAPQAPRALHARLCVNAVGSIGHILACLRQPRQRRAVGNVRGAVRRVCLPVWIRERGRRRRAAGHAAPHGARGRTVSRRPRR